MHKFIDKTKSREIYLTLCLLPAGDGCFYVGLGGKETLPKQSSFEPYQCCPTKVTRGTKVAKMSPSAPMGKPAAFGKSRQSTNSKPPSPIKPKLPAVKIPAPKPKLKEPASKSTAVKAEKPAKGKKGFFGSGKYIWWW